MKQVYLSLELTYIWAEPTLYEANIYNIRGIPWKYLLVQLCNNKIDKND